MFTPAAIPFAALSPCAVATTLWQRRGRLGITLVVKATFAFEPDKPATRIEPLDVVVRDRHFDKSPTNSVAAACELAPLLPSAGVVLTGHAHAPADRGRVSSLSTRLVLVREQVLLDKTVHVYGDRNPAKPTECVPFQLVPLRWELAVGGPKHPDHPVGVGTDCVPNLIDAVDASKPGGFGPIGSSWPVRRRLLGDFDARRLHARVPEFSDVFDWRYFNPAPADQQLAGYLRGDEWLVLQGMSAAAFQVRTRIPLARAAARAVMVTPSGPTPYETIPLVADLLVIDADRELFSVVWRGNRVFAHQESDLPLLGVLAAVTTHGQPPAWPDEGDLGPLRTPLMSAAAAEPAAIVAQQLGSAGPRPGVSGPIFHDVPGLDAAMFGTVAATAPGDDAAADDGDGNWTDPPPVSLARPDPTPPGAAWGATVPKASDAAAAAAAGNSPTLPHRDHGEPSGPRPSFSQNGSGEASDEPPPPSGPVPEPPLREGDDIPAVILGPYDVGTHSWQIQPPQHSLIVFVKGTYLIAPDAPAQPHPKPDFVTGERFYQDDAAGSCISPDDTALFKPKTDVVMMGHAHAPRGRATAMEVSFRFGHADSGFDKTILVLGDRQWQRSLGRAKATEPDAFEKMPLVYERAYGGPKYDKNPAGVGQGTSERLPNLELPGQPITSPRDQAEPACFAPIAMEWKDRWAKMGSYGRRWLKTRWPYFPDDFDWSFYQAAPADQQLARPLRGDEPFEATGVHPEHRELKGSLPGVRPRCFVIERAAASHLAELELRLDTASFDFDELKLTLLWRGRRDVADDDAPEVSHLFVLPQPLDEPELTPEQIQQRYLVAITPFDEVEEIPEHEAPAAANDTEEEGEQETERAIAEAESQIAAAERALAEALAEAGLKAPSEAEPPPPPDPQAIAEALRRSGATQGEIDEVLEALAPAAPPEAAPASEPPLPVRERVIAMLKARQSFADFDFEEADLSDLDFADCCLDRAVMFGAAFARCRFDRASMVEVQARKADLAGASLVEANLAGADLTRTELSGAQLDSAVLTGADLSRSRAADASFVGATAAGAYFTRGEWQRADFRRITAPDSDFGFSTMDEANLAGAELVRVGLREVRGRSVVFDGARLDAAYVESAQLSGCSMKAVRAATSVFEQSVMDETDFHGADLRDTSWLRAVCRKANFAQADLSEASMTRANLSGSIFLRANLMMATLEGADLTIADLRGANLHSVGLWKANLQDAKLEGAITSKSSLVMRSE